MDDLTAHCGMFEHETLQTIGLLQIVPRGKKVIPLKWQHYDFSRLPEMNTSKVTDCVEILCQKGCREVSQVILAMERGEPVAEAEHLGPDERQKVLAELKAIMAVYQKGGTCR